MQRYLVTATTGNVRTTLIETDLAALEARLCHARLRAHGYGVQILIYASTAKHARHIVDSALAALPRSVPALGISEVVTAPARRAAA